MFPGFLWKYPITKISVTPGSTNQSTNVWVPESDSSGNAITGMVQSITIKELHSIDGGLVSIGDRKITVDKTVNLKPGDKLKITEDISGNETEWIVAALKTSPSARVSSLKLDFQTFYLKRKT